MLGLLTEGLAAAAVPENNVGTLCLFENGELRRQNPVHEPIGKAVPRSKPFPLRAGTARDHRDKIAREGKIGLIEKRNIGSKNADSGTNAGFFQRFGTGFADQRMQNLLKNAPASGIVEYKIPEAGTVQTTLIVCKSGSECVRDGAPGLGHCQQFMHAPVAVEKDQTVPGKLLQKPAECGFARGDAAGDRENFQLKRKRGSAGSKMQTGRESLLSRPAQSI